jgi:hypothetical protein
MVQEYKQQREAGNHLRTKGRFGSSGWFETRRSGLASGWFQADWGICR